MAYKFQMGRADLSGSLDIQGLNGELSVTTQGGVKNFQASQAGVVSGSGAFLCDSLKVDSTERISNAGAGNFVGVAAGGAITTATTIDASALASLDGGIDVNGDFTVNTDGAIVAVGINAGGALSGVTTLAASGLASVASISMDDGSTLGPDSVADLWTFSSDGDTTQKNGTYDFDIASHDGTNGLKLGGVIVNASAADLNFTNVAAAGTAEASKAVVLDANKNITALGTIGSAAITSTGLVTAVGVAAGGAISTATNIDGTGDLTMGTITMSGMTVDADGDTIAKTLATPDGGTLGSATNADLITLAASAVTIKSNSDFNIAKTAGLQLGGSAVSSTAAELNFLDGFGAATYTPAADSFVWFDADDNKMKRMTNDAFLGTIAGTGVTVVANQLTVDTTGGDSMSVSASVDSHTAVPGLNYLPNLSAADFSLVLPTSAGVGDLYVIKMGDIANARKLFITTFGDQQIDGLAELIVESPYAAVTIIANASGSFRAV